MTRSGRLGQTVLGLYGLVTILLPMAALIDVALLPFWTGHVDIGQFSLANFRAAFHDPAIINAVGDSIRYTLTAIAFLLPLCFAAAKIIYHRRQRRFIGALAEVATGLPLGIPAVVFGIGFLLAYINMDSLGLYGSGYGLVILYVTLMLPFGVRLILVGMIAMGDDLVDAAAVSGAGLIRRTFTVDIPLLRRTLGMATALMFILLAYEFSASMMVVSPYTQVMGTYLYTVWVSGDNSQLAVVSLFMCVITLAGAGVAVWLGGATVRRGSRSG